MSGAQLDQIVKGSVPNAPSPSPPPPLTSREPSPEVLDDRGTTPSAGTPTPSPDDPLALLPSAPPQIYLNLLILEASLRSQYLLLRARRRQNTFFLVLLAGWLAFFFHALFLRAREDGSGIGGSVYWAVDVAERVALMGGVVTALLVWGTGQWERGVRRPRRFVGLANRGLRAMNCKLVVLRGPWWRELAAALAFWWWPLPTARRRRTAAAGARMQIGGGAAKRTTHGHARHEHEELGWTDDDEDLAPGGDHVKLLLLPKPFSPDFRENWELYRAEYWERENERRASLCRQLKAREYEHGQGRRGLWGWLGWFRRRSSPPDAASDDEGGRAPPPSRPLLLQEKEGRLAPGRRAVAHSREPSRSSTYSGADGDERPPSRNMQRAHGAGAADGKRRTRASLAAAGQHDAKQARMSAAA